MAYSLLDTKPDQMTLQDRLPMTIGVRKSNGTITPIFAQGSLLPCKAMRTLPTVRDNQNTILLHLYQGNETLAHNNEKLQTFIFSELRPGPKGSIRIEALFELNENGILRVKARDKMTKKRVVVQALSAKELEEFLNRVEPIPVEEKENPIASSTAEQEQQPAQPISDTLITEQPSTLITVTPDYFVERQPKQESENTERKVQKVAPQRSKPVAQKNTAPQQTKSSQPKPGSLSSHPLHHDAPSSKSQKLDPRKADATIVSKNAKNGFFERLKQWFLRIVGRS